MLFVALLCVAVLADRHDSGRRFDDLNRAVREADKLIGEAEEVLAANNLMQGQPSLFVGRHGELQEQNSFLHGVNNDNNGRRHRDRSDSSSSESVHNERSELSTSSHDSNRELQQAFEERLVEVAIANALKNKATTAPVQKKAYQARFEITQFEGNDLTTQTIQFGPTVITTRRNSVLLNTQPDDVMPFFTAGDYLDANRNGQPDIIEALVKSRDTDNPAEYLRVLRTRAVKAVTRGPATVRGSMDLINIIVLEGFFSVTNQLVSNCFSATSDPEFVFEAVVGAAPGQKGVLVANPTQNSHILLMGSTALNESDTTFNGASSTRNVFFQNGAFVESPPPMGLYLNLFDRFLPGADVIAQQGRVFFGPCHQFNYFQ